MRAPPLGDLRAQVRAIRSSVALGPRDGLTLLELDANAGLDALDGRVATALDIREAQFRQALRLDEAGRPIADLLVGFFRGTLHVMGLGLSHAEMIQALGAESARPVHEDHVVFGLDGPFAWEVLSRWDTAAAVGLPYLGAYSPREGVLVIREGRTGEYGYSIIVPRDQADTVWEELVGAAAPMDPGFVGDDARRHCALENWVFDITRDGAFGLDALELQLTWRLDLLKEATGLDAIRAHRTSGLRRRIVAMQADGPVDSGATVTAAGSPIGQVLSTAPDLFGTDHRVVAVLDMPWANAGLEYAIDDRPARTVSAPFVLNNSLFVNPQRHSWDTRDEIELPSGAPWPGSTFS